MRKLIIAIVLLSLLCVPAYGTEEEIIGTDALLDGLEGAAEELMPDVDPAEQTDLWDGFKQIVQSVLAKSTETIRSGLRLCAILLCVVTLCAVVDFSSVKNGTLMLRAVGALGICAAATGTFQSMIYMAGSTVEQISTYSSFMLPVMASATAMSGGLNSASALYAGTVIFSEVLLQLISKLLIPTVYFFLAICTAEAALGSDMLSELREFVGWLIAKSLRILLYIFLTFVTLTGVISGTADAVAVKATKAAVSGMIPVVGSILSDASETLLASAAVVKNSAGIIGMLAVVSICMLPVVKVGSHYLLLKITAAVSGTIAQKPHVNLLKHFSTAMGYLLAMCGSSGLLLLISTVCFMRLVC